MKVYKVFIPGAYALLVIARTNKRAKAIGYQHMRGLDEPDYLDVRCRRIRNPRHILEREGLTTKRELVIDTGVACLGCDQWLHEEAYRRDMCNECFAQLIEVHTEDIWP